MRDTVYLCAFSTDYPLIRELEARMIRIGGVRIGDGLYVTPALGPADRIKDYICEGMSPLPAFLIVGIDDRVDWAAVLNVEASDLMPNQPSAGSLDHRPF